jgi:hypothetical protein
MYGGLIAGLIGSVLLNGKGLLRKSGVERFNGGLKGSLFLFEYSLRNIIIER